MHAFQGNPASHHTLIDNRRMLEVQHWYTAFSRAKYLSDVFIVDVQLPSPTARFASTIVYLISSPNTQLVYVGHTTTSIQKRFEGHKKEFADKTLKRRCSSHEVLTHGDARTSLLERYPCGSIEEARARERYFIEHTPHCVNKVMPGRSREECKMQRARSTCPPAPRVQSPPPPPPPLQPPQPAAGPLPQLAPAPPAVIAEREEELATGPASSICGFVAKLASRLAGKGTKRLRTDLFDEYQKNRRL